MAGDWVPLSARAGDKRFELVDEGVPEWIRDDLLSWMNAALDDLVDHVTTVHEDAGADEQGVIRQMGRELRLWLGDDTTDAVTCAEDSDKALLDLIDYLLAHGAPRPDEERSVARLESYLKHGCMWTPMKAERGRWMLVSRVDRTAVEAAEQTIATAGPAAAAHLGAAWTEAYGREPNPATAYEQAVKAVEAAAAPLFAPDDTKATLGKMIANVRDKPDKWTVVLDSDDPVGQLVAMMQLLWQAHSRHGKSEAVADATDEQAKAAVHVATALVQLLSNGAVESAP